MRHVLIGEKSEIICSSGSSGTLHSPSVYVTCSKQLHNEYADNVPMPAFAHRCCSNWSIIPARRAHMSKSHSSRFALMLGHTSAYYMYSANNIIWQTAASPPHTHLVGPIFKHKRQSVELDSIYSKWLTRGQHAANVSTLQWASNWSPS